MTPPPVEADESLREPPPSAPLEAILAPAVQETIRREIHAAGGNEVFFFGEVDDEGVVARVELMARGNEGAVPALVSKAPGFDVAIHNHPSGNLLPSDADLQIAHHLAEEGLGFLIVDNEVGKLYEVIPARVARRSQPIPPEEVEAFLGEEGPLARVLGESYEPRPAQVRMSVQVAEAISREGVALLEAGTGTGKTFAYLVPSALFALRNGEKVVVSTATKNLQGQIVRKDVPALKAALEAAGLPSVAAPEGPPVPEGAGEERGLRVAVVKGRGNYVSLRRAAEAAAAVERDAGLFASDDELEEVRRLAAWAASSASGERAELTPPPSSDAWEHVTSTADDCLGPKCPRFQECRYYDSRRAASKAHVLVVNHHLLFADLSLKAELGFERAAALPPYTRVVLDEGHHVEHIASEHFGLSLTELGLTRPLGRLQHRRRPKRGLLPALIRALTGKDPEEQRLAREVEERLLPLRAQTIDTLELSLAEVAVSLRLAAEGQGREVKLRLGPGHNALLEPLGDAQQALKLLCGRLGRTLDAIKGVLPAERLARAQTTIRPLDAALRQLNRAASGLEAFVKAGQPDDEGKVAASLGTVRWAEVWRGKGGRDRLRLRLAPLEVGPALVGALFRPAKSVVLTSATLMVQGRSDYLESRLGLLPPPGSDAGPPVEPIYRDAIPSPFEYGRQALLAVPADAPTPDKEGFEAAMIEGLRKLLEVSRGRAFVLFTSYAQLNRVHGALVDELDAAGLVALRQGEASRDVILERFREGNAVLFGTDSFWEGVDVPGDALVLVAIARLPFSVPNEPLAQARAEAVEARGGNPFRELQLPRAVLKLTQGFGRLIRGHNDRGAVVVFDKRLVTRWYGRAFLDSLPPVRVEVEPMLDLLPLVGRYVR